MSEALTREAALDWLNDLGTLRGGPSELSPRSFAVDDNALELGDLLEDGVPAHSFARPGYALSEDKQAGDIRGSEYAR